MAYRFRPAEVEAMKNNILSHMENEREPDSNGHKSAWRLRLCIEGLLMCCRPSKREAAKLRRELWLFESLTKNNLPNWQGCDYWHTTDDPDQLPALPEVIEMAI